MDFAAAGALALQAIRLGTDILDAINAKDQAAFEKAVAAMKAHGEASVSAWQASPHPTKAP